MYVSRLKRVRCDICGAEKGFSDTLAPQQQRTLTVGKTVHTILLCRIGAILCHCYGSKSLLRSTHELLLWYRVHLSRG
jgi:hypothetical protein